MKDKKALMLTIGNNLREYRLSMKMTQDEIAEKAGLSVPFYANLERGVKGMSLYTLAELSKTLGISADYLLFNDSCEGHIKNIEAMLRTESEDTVILAEKLVKLLVESRVFPNHTA